jgi:hypothetical protein
VSSYRQDDSRLTVGHWVSTYRVPSDAAANDPRRRFAQITPDLLAERCAAIIAPVVRSEDASVWRIRRLNLQASAGPSRVPGADAADTWSRQFAFSLAKVLQQGEQSDAVLRFENYPDFVARFVLDLAGNRAWDKWYYEEFEDLRIFRPGQAIRTVLLQAPGLAADVTIELAARNTLDVVLSVLTQKDASLIFDACFAPASATHTAAGVDKWVAFLLESCAAAPLSSFAPFEHSACDALRLFARAVSAQPGTPFDEALRGAILGLLELRRVLATVRSPLVLESVIRKAAAGDLDAAAALALRGGSFEPGAALRFFADRMQGDPDWGREAAAVILSGNLPARVVSLSSVPEGTSLLSPFAGIFLLGPSFLNLRCGQLTDSMAEPCEDPATLSAALRQWLAVKCFGSTRAAGVVGDAAVALFTGFTGPSLRSSLSALAVAPLPLDAARDFHRQSLRECEHFSDRCLFAERITLEDRNVFVLRDLVHNEWLELRTIPPENEDLSLVLFNTLARVFPGSAQRPKLLVLSDSLASRLDISALRSAADECLVAHPPDAAQLAASSGLSESRLRILLAATAQELTYFSTRAFLPDTPARLDDAFTLIARSVLRDFSRRLYGFELSSPDYLYQNFLAGTGSVLCRDEALEVRLPPSALSLILRMAGLQQQKFQPPWLQGREVWLLPPQD